MNTKVSAGFDILMQSGPPSQAIHKQSDKVTSFSNQESLKNDHEQFNMLQSSQNQKDILFGEGSQETQKFGISNKQNLNYSLSPAYNFKVTFKVGYQTEMGQSLCIVGNLKELGSWKNFQAKMKWTEGHIWELSDFQINQPYFQYKYVVLNGQNQAERWEQGINRIADLALLKSQQSSSDPFQGDRVQLNDQFDRYSVNFSLYYPLKQNEYMRINGDPEELGFWNKGQGPLRMKESKEEIVWLTGQKVRPWEFFVNFKQGVCPKHMIYKYSIRNDAEGTTVWEREPSRVLSIQDPNNYKGELGQQGSNIWRNVDKVFIVNGHIEMTDANFVGGLSFDQIGDTGIFIGPYPQIEEDTQTMMEAGITGVLNVQTDIDINHRGVNWPKMLEYYNKRGISAVHFPIHDFNEEHLTSRLFDGAKTLNDMINNKGQKVYVHCTAGMGRAPACVLVYLVLFKRVSCWQDPKAVDLFIKSYRKVSTPNMRAIGNALAYEACRQFQSKQQPNFTE